MGRPASKHINEQELEALVSSWPEKGQTMCCPSTASRGQAERHVSHCAECTRKVAQYRQLIGRMNVYASEFHPQQAGCPSDIDWHDVTAGLWPEVPTRQLITHAARCSHCGPLLRAASADDPTPEEQQYLAQLAIPARPRLQPKPVRVFAYPSFWRQLWTWKALAPAAAVVLLVALLSALRFSSAQLSGNELAQFAVETHQQHFQRNVALDFHSDSQQVLNQWLHDHSEFRLALPASSDTPREGLPYHLEGARMLEIRHRNAAYIAYRTGTSPASLVVTPVAAALASGGVEAAFKKVTFHYYTIRDYKVVTWSVHGLTYALVSEEGNKTQRSCMVCHSAMRDRDFTNTPTPLADRKSSIQPIWQ